ILTWSNPLISKRWFLWPKPSLSIGCTPTLSQYRIDRSKTNPRRFPIGRAANRVLPCFELLHGKPNLFLRGNDLPLRPFACRSLSQVSNSRAWRGDNFLTFLTASVNCSPDLQQLAFAIRERS